MLEHLFHSPGQIAANPTGTFTPVQVIRGQMKACIHIPERGSEPVFTVSRMMPDGRQSEYDSYTLSGLSDSQLQDLCDLLIGYREIVEYDPFSDLFTRLKLDCKNGQLPQQGAYLRNKDYSDLQNVDLNISIQDVEPETFQDYLDHIAQQRITVSREDSILSLNLPFNRHDGNSVRVSLQDGRESVWEGVIVPTCPDTYVLREAPLLADALLEAFQRDGIDSAAEHLQLHGVESGMTLLKSKKVGVAQLSVYQSRNSLTVRFVQGNRVLLNFKKEVGSRQELKSVKRVVLKGVAGLVQRVEEASRTHDFLTKLESDFEVSDRIVHYRHIVDTVQRLFEGKKISGLNLLVDVYGTSPERWCHAIYGLNKYELSPIAPKPGMLNMPEKLSLSVNKRLEGALQFVNPLGGKRTFLLDSVVSGSDQACRRAALEDCIAQFRVDPFQSVSHLAFEAEQRYRKENYRGITAMTERFQIGCVPFPGLSEEVIEHHRSIFEYACRLFEDSQFLYKEKHKAEPPPFYISQDAKKGIEVPIYMGKYCCLILSIKPKNYLVASSVITQLSLKSRIPRWFGRGHRDVVESLAAPPRSFTLLSIERLMEELYHSDAPLDTADQVLNSDPVLDRSIKKYY